MKKFSSLTTAALVAFAVLGASPAVRAGEELVLAVSIYTGWMPWYYAKESGIIKKWGDKYGVNIKVVYMDYLPSVEAFTAGKAHACVMTNMEALDMPAAAGVDTTALIIGDYSHGNDALLARVGTLQELKGEKLSLVENSVPHYVLARALEMNGMKEKDVKVVNTSDSDIAPVFTSQKTQKAIVTWNPMVMTVEQLPGVKKLFDSSKIPGEILDLCVVNSKTLKENPAFGEALVGAWFEVMATMSNRGPESAAAMTQMAKLAGCPLAEFKQQLATTAMLWTPQSAVDFAKSPELKKNMDFVRNFCFTHKLLGEGVKNADVVGIQYPDGSTQGDAANVKLRFDTTFMQKALDGKLK